MSTALTLNEEGRKVIVMRSRLVHWVSKETADRITQSFQNQQAHRFITIAELKIVINTAEIEGVYTREQYDDICKIQQGLFRCAYGEWHSKKTLCHCAADKFRQAEHLRRKREAQAEYDELTPEQKAHNAERMAEIRKKLTFLSEKKRDSKGYGVRASELKKRKKAGQEYELRPNEYILED